MLLDGNIVLCGRQGAGGGGKFDGSLSSLSLYDSFLNMNEVQALYNMVRLGQHFLCLAGSLA